MDIRSRLGKIQAKIKNPKNSAENPFFHSKYAPLPDILDIVRDLNSAFGISIIQMPETRFENGAAYVGVKTIITAVDEEGDDIPDDLDCGWIGMPMANLDAQKVGAVITYLRRYAIKSIYAIEGAGEDDDANSAVSSEKDKRAMGNPETIKAEYLAANTPEKKYAVIAKANTLKWNDRDYQDLKIFFETHGA